MFKEFLFSILLIFTLHARSQTSDLMTLHGTIVGKDAMPVPYVSISVDNGFWKSGETTVSYKDGNFHITGVKLNEKILFTHVGYKPAFFVVNRRYNELKIILEQDTLLTKRDNLGLILISNKKPALLIPKYNFLESTIPVNQKTVEEYRQDSLSDYRSINKVEVVPVLIYSSFTQFFDSLKVTIKQLPQKEAKITATKVYYTVEKDGSVIVSQVHTTNYNFIIKSVFQSTIKAAPAIQNGRNVSVACSFEFDINIKNKGGDITFSIYKY